MKTMKLRIKRKYRIDFFIELILLMFSMTFKYLFLLLFVILCLPLSVLITAKMYRRLTILVYEMIKQYDKVI